MNIGSKIQLVEYSEKACAVFGHTRECKDDLKRMGGKFNMNLIKREPIMSDNGRDCIGENQKTEPGWIFPMHMYQKINTYIETGSLELDTTHQNSNSSSITITRNAFDKLVDRIATLEAEVKQLKQQLTMKENDCISDEDGVEDRGDDKPVRRLLRKKDVK